MVGLCLSERRTNEPNWSRSGGLSKSLLDIGVAGAVLRSARLSSRQGEKGVPSKAKAKALLRIERPGILRSVGQEVFDLVIWRRAGLAFLRSVGPIGAQARLIGLIAAQTLF